MKLRSIFRSLLLGLFAGPVIAVSLASVFLWCFPVLEDALQRWRDEDFAISPVVLILAVGALVGSIVALTIGRRSLPLRVKHASIGALVAVAMVILLTWIIARVFGGPSPKGEGTTFALGLCAVPVALVAGTTIGLLVGRCYSMRGLKKEVVSAEGNS